MNRRHVDEDEKDDASSQDDEPRPQVTKLRTTARYLRSKGTVASPREAVDVNFFFVEGTVSDVNNKKVKMRICKICG